MSKSVLYAVKTNLSYAGNNFSCTLPYESKSDAERVVYLNSKQAELENNGMKLEQIMKVVRWHGTRKDHLRKSKHRIKLLRKSYNFLNSVTV